MLKGVKAFEACWSAIKQTYPTSRAENTLLVQSMGRFVDQYATREEIRGGLPEGLKQLFDRLIDAYVEGYELPQPQPKVHLKPAMAMAAIATTQPKPIPTASVATPSAVTSAVKPKVASIKASNAVAEAVSGVSVTSRLTAATIAARELRQRHAPTVDRTEAETLVIDEANL